MTPRHTAEPKPANQDGPVLFGPAALEQLLRATSIEAASEALLAELVGKGRFVVEVQGADVLRVGPESPSRMHVLHTGVGGRVVLRRADGSALPAFAPAEAHWLELGGLRLGELLAMRSLLESVSGLEHAERLQRALFAIADMAGSERDMTSMLRDLHRIIGELMYAENFYIALYDKRRDSLQFLYFADTVDTTEYSPDLEIPMASIAGGLTWYLIHDSRPLMGSTEQLRQQVSGELRIHGADSLDWLGVPMVRNGEAVGALVVQSYIEANRYTETDRAVLAFVADHVLTAVERKRTQRELEHRVADRTRELAEANADLQRQIAERERSEHLQAVLYRIAALSTSEEDAEHFYRHIHRAVAEVVVADNFYIALISEDGTQLEFPYYVDAEGGTRPARPLGRGLTEYAMRLGKPVLVGPVEADRLAAAGEIQAAVALAGMPASSWLGVPLTINGTVIGLVAVQSYRADQPYDAADAEVLTFVAHQIARSLERRKHAQSLRRWNAELEERVEQRTRELSVQIQVREKVEAELKHQVMHDSLTGLPNRLYLRDRLERAIADRRRRPQRRFALLYLDVDRFKLFNDSLGHLAGDDVLREVARRLKTCIREPDVVARLSGDEFAIFIEHAPIPQTACKIAQRIAASLLPPMSIAGKELQASASIGIAVSDARHASPDDLFHDADVALYRAKTAGRQRFVLFDDNLHRTAMDVLEVEHQLRAALQRNEFVPFFQPLVRLADGEVVGYEALIRWQHPTRGLLEPAAFLPVAEESGLIEPMDWELYRLALQAARSLLRPGQYVTLNSSPRHFQSDDFDARLLQLAADQGMPPSQLRIEVTEGTLLSDPEAAVGILSRLRAAGVEAALDDFGTGYSSLSYVNRFALRMIKIDRSFVTPLGGEDSQRSSAIISAILALAQSLSMDVIAEGVETEAQRQALLGMGCIYAQGYLFGRPARAGEL